MNCFQKKYVNKRAMHIPHPGSTALVTLQCVGFLATRITYARMTLLHTQHTCGEMFGAKNQRADQEEEEMAVELRAKTHEKRGPIAICADGEAVRLSAASRQGDEKQKMT